MKETWNETPTASRTTKPSPLALLRDLDPAKLLAIIVLVIYLPAIMGIALLILFTSSGPAFVSRAYQRPNGEVVDLWEFRTVCWQRQEPTWFGKALRQTNMVRMPALVNVLKGDIEAGERVKAA